MGITDLWPVLSAAAGKRVPFPVFLSHFLVKNARPPRLAIDAYMFLFWSQIPTLEVLDESVQRRILRNFMAKLWYLVQNNVSFVVVFDGRYKPGKLRHGFIPDLPESLSYDEALRYFLTISPSKYDEDNGLVKSLKKILQRNKIDWVQAPAEAEAECAWLQRLGIVDYVVTDDSDAFVFGATRVLRMFNRVKYFDSENNPVLSSTDYYVTPLEMSQIADVTGLTRDRLIMIAVLRGGDYSTGSEGIGITRAKELAMCGTTLLANLPRKKVQDFGSFPDFTKDFIDSFLVAETRGQVLADPYYGMKNELDRAESLKSFSAHINEFLLSDASRIFGRTTTLKDIIRIDDYYAMLYFFPFVNRSIFKFTHSSVSFGELSHVPSDLAATVPGRFRRTNAIVGAGCIGVLILDKGLNQTFESELEPSTSKFALPRERKYNLRPFAVKLLAQEKYWNRIQFARTKALDDVQLAVLRFERIALNEAVYLKKYTKSEFRPDLDLVDYPRNTMDGNNHGEAKEIFQQGGSQEVNKDLEGNFENEIEELPEDEEKVLTVMVPLEVVRYISKKYAEECLLLPKRKSPRKKPLPQKTTLDTIWSKMPLLSRSPPSLFEKKPLIINSHKLNLNSESERVQLKHPKEEEKITIDLTNFQDSPETQFKVDLPSRQLRQKARSLSRSPSPTLKERPFNSSRKLKLSPKKYKQELLPGQSILTSFFQPASKDANGPLHSVGSDKEMPEYKKMQQGFYRVPSLSGDVPESPETSPTKRHKKTSMDLSPESSPLKAKSSNSYDTEFFPELFNN